MIGTIIASRGYECRPSDPTLQNRSVKFNFSRHVIPSFPCFFRSQRAYLCPHLFLRLTGPDMLLGVDCNRDCSEPPSTVRKCQEMSGKVQIHVTFLEEPVVFWR